MEISIELHGAQMGNCIHAAIAPPAAESEPRPNATTPIHKMMTVNERLAWRYATKKYDATKTVPAEKLERIVEAVRLAPTSSGLQPFELFVVSNPEIRAKIRDVAWSQAQITDCSHLLMSAVSRMTAGKAIASNCWASSPTGERRLTIRPLRDRPTSA